MQFVGVSAGTAASLKSRDAPVKVVAAGATYNPKAPNTALVAARGKAITRARDLVGKTIAVDGPNSIAHLGVLEWLEKSGVDGDDVKIAFIPFAQMLGALAQGTIDAALVPEPWRTLALQQGAKHIAYPWNAVCAQTCVLAFWIAPANVDPNLAARLRNAIQNAAVWANQRKNDEVSGKILAKYVPIDAAVIKKMTRTTYSTRLRVSLAQPWLDVFAEVRRDPGLVQAGRPRQVASSASSTAWSSVRRRPVLRPRSRSGPASAKTTAANRSRSWAQGPKPRSLSERAGLLDGLERSPEPAGALWLAAAGGEGGEERQRLYRVSPVPHVTRDGERRPGMPLRLIGATLLERVAGESVQQVRLHELVAHFTCQFQ